MKRWINILIWALLLFLITPSTMALASWNAVPGDTTYPWKLSLERVLLMFMSPSSKLKSTTQVKITERRFNELEQTLGSEYAFESLDNLEKQLVETSSNIQQINKQETQKQVKEQYVASLKKMSSSLEQQKAQVIAGNVPAVTQKSTSTKQPSNNTTTKTNSNQNTNTSTNTNANTSANTNTNTNKNNNKVVNPTATPSIVASPTPTVPTPSNEDLLKEIEETKEKIEAEIINVETMTVNSQQNNNNNDEDEEEEEKRPRWVKPEPTVQTPTRSDTGNVSLPNLGNNNKNNDQLAPAQTNTGNTGNRSGTDLRNRYIPN